MVQTGANRSPLTQQRMHTNLPSNLGSPLPSPAHTQHITHKPWGNKQGDILHPTPPPISSPMLLTPPQGEAPGRIHCVGRLRGRSPLCPSTNHHLLIFPDLEQVLVIETNLSIAGGRLIKASGRTPSAPSGKFFCCPPALCHQLICPFARSHHASYS